MMSLTHILLEDYAGIVTTKSEGIAETSTHLTLLSLVEGEVEVVVDLLVLIIFLMVDGGRNNIVLNSQNGNHSLNSTSSTQQVTSH